MLTDKDIDKLLAVFATKQDLQRIEERIQGLTETVQGLVISCDGMAKSIYELRSEYVGIKYQLDRHERWIPQIAEHVGLRLSTD